MIDRRARAAPGNRRGIEMTMLHRALALLMVGFTAGAIGAAPQAPTGDPGLVLVAAAPKKGPKAIGSPPKGGIAGAPKKQGAINGTGAGRRTGSRVVGK
jgi:hypothetical protein